MVLDKTRITPDEVISESLDDSMHGLRVCPHPRLSVAHEPGIGNQSDVMGSADDFRIN
jgi:hypothetical protein